MRVLLDTHILLWALAEPDRLPPSTRDVIEDPGNDVLFSAASIWEIAIKSGLGRTDFTVRPEQIAHDARQAGLTELPVHAHVAAQVATLPPHHRDPFDRLLVAQAIAIQAVLFTADVALRPYSDLVTLVSRTR